MIKNYTPISLYNYLFYYKVGTLSSVIIKNKKKIHKKHKFTLDNSNIYDLIYK